MTSTDPATMKLPRGMEDRFWALVGIASEQILGDDADLVKNYRDRLQRASPMERMLALHDEPIDIAADLSGRPVTERQLTQYDEMRMRFDEGWAESDVIFIESAPSSNGRVVFEEKTLQILASLRHRIRWMLAGTIIAAFAGVGAAIAAIIAARSTF